MLLSGGHATYLVFSFPATSHTWKKLQKYFLQSIGLFPIANDVAQKNEIGTQRSASGLSLDLFLQGKKKPQAKLDCGCLLF